MWKQHMRLGLHQLGPPKCRVVCLCAVLARGRLCCPEAGCEGFGVIAEAGAWTGPLSCGLPESRSPA